MLGYRFLFMDNEGIIHNYKQENDSSLRDAYVITYMLILIETVDVMNIHFNSAKVRALANKVSEAQSS